MPRAAACSRRRWCSALLQIVIGVASDLGLRPRRRRDHRLARRGARSGRRSQRWVLGVVFAGIAVRLAVRRAKMSATRPAMLLDRLAADGARHDARVRAASGSRRTPRVGSRTRISRATRCARSAALGALRHRRARGVGRRRPRLRVARRGARGDRRRRRRDVDDRQRAELGRLRTDQSRSAPTRRRSAT